MYSFPKSERLTGKKRIGMLFEKGRTDLRTFYLFPFRVIYRVTPTTTPPQPQPRKEGLNTHASASPSLRGWGWGGVSAVLINVSKRSFKRAVDRNLLRRRIREAYRLNKALLGQQNSPPTEIAFLYIAKTKATFEEIEKGMKRTLKKVDSGFTEPPK